MNKLTPLKKQAKPGTASLLHKAARFLERPLSGHKADRAWKDLLPSKEQTRTSP